MALAARGVHVQAEARDEGRSLWATGARGLEELSATHHRLVGTGVKGQAALLRYDAAGAPQLFAGGARHPAWGRHRRRRLNLRT